MLVDDLYLHRLCLVMRMSRSTWGADDRRGEQNIVFATLMSLIPNDLKHSEAGFSTTSIDLLCLRMPRSRHLAIFVQTTDRDRQTGRCRETDRRANRLLYPCCACAHAGVIKSDKLYEIIITGLGMHANWYIATMYCCI
jgi:hypothetical protein